MKEQEAEPSFFSSAQNLDKLPIVLPQFPNLQNGGRTAILT